jgi:peptidoglycan hydrolase CwlO-like protein
MKERSPRPSLVLVIVVLLIMAAPGSLSVAWSQSSESLNNKIQSQKQQLKKIESDIKQHRAKSRELVREEANVLNQLSHVDKEISLEQKYLGGLHEREKLLGEQIDSLKASVSYEGAMLVYQRHRLGERVRQMYKRGPNYRMEIILGSSNLQEALRRSKFLGLMAERDANLIEEVRERKSSLEQEQAMLTETMADIAALRGEREAESQKLAKSKTERVAMLKRIRNEKSKHGQAIAQLEASQEKMKDLIGELEQKRLTQRDTGDLPTGDFAALKGRLIRPVDGSSARTGIRSLER